VTAPGGVIFRAYVDADEKYIYSTWLRDLRDADPSPLPDELWFPAHRAMIDGLLADPAVRVVVAAAEDKPGEILGYAVAEPHEVLWWIQVRKDPQLREKGLARAMLQEVNCPPGTPAAWATPSSRDRLRNPCRSRSIRRERARRTGTR